MTESAAPEVQVEKIPQQPITARYSRYYRNMRFIMVAAILGAAVWFGYDGWKGYPTLNAKIDAVTDELQKIQSTGASTDEQKKRVTELDKEKKELGEKKNSAAILLQKLLAIGLPVLAAAYVVFFIRRSRGEYRLEGDTLHAPGHPPVSIASFRQIDGKHWRKKGIAYLYYGDASANSRIRLDTFIYDQRPMDDMYEVIARHHGVWDATKPLPAGTKA